MLTVTLMTELTSHLTLMESQQVVNIKLHQGRELAGVPGKTSPATPMPLIGLYGHTFRT